MADEFAERVNEYLGEFLDETKGHITAFEENLLKAEDFIGKEIDPELINTIMRAAHTIKGLSAMLGFVKTSKLTHQMENLLIPVRQKETKITAEIINLEFDALDVLKQLFSELTEKGAEISNTDEILEKLNQKLPDIKKVEVAPPPPPPEPQTTKSSEPVQPVKDQSPKAEAKPISQIVPPQTIRVEANKLDILLNLVGDLIITKASFSRLGSTMGNNIINNRLPSLMGEMNLYFTRLQEDLFKKIKNISAQSSNSETTSSSFEHILKSFKEIELITRQFQEIIFSMDVQIKELMKNRKNLSDFNEASHKLGRIVHNIQKTVMQARMVPVETVFQQFKRLVRDLSRDKGMTINLNISGEETKLDKKLIDELGTPLTHLIRNSVDHGIESLEERKKIGKSEQGEVTLKAYYSGNHVCIEVSDDGAGLNIEGIKNKVIEKGMKTREETSHLTKREIMEFIFLPGLSTKQSVTAISGRGVGMDVVKQAIIALKGTIIIESEKGKGTTFILRLPLTLAIIPALLVSIGEEIYSIPLELVNEIIRSSNHDVYMVEESETIKLRDEVISLLSLDKIIGTKEELITKNDTLHNIVIVGSNSHKMGIRVDNLIGEREIVIKHLSDEFNQVVGISGATILEDGNLSLILDIPAIIERVAQG